MKIKECLSTQFNKYTYEKMIEKYLADYCSFLRRMPQSQQRKECVSGYNRIQRAKYWSCESLRIDVKVGDLCYLDYGQAYINEAGYQHFGLVVSIFNYKLLVIPMTSNSEAVKQARNVSNKGKLHLYYIGKIKGLNKPSVLFLNDCKFVNSSRVISINGHIEPSCSMFREICQNLKAGIFGQLMVE